MRYYIFIVVALLLISCAPWTTQELTRHSFNGNEVTIGMNTDDVRRLAGPPTKISLPDAVSSAVFQNGVYANQTRGQQYWSYGSFKAGDKEEIAITFTDGTATKISKYTMK